MELKEREVFFATLRAKFKHIIESEGHCIFVAGDAGIGKTSLIRSFCREIKDGCKIYQGTCDALFTPRPLAPLYDIAMQLDNNRWLNDTEQGDRAGLFARFFHEISNHRETTVVIFEDIHWADEATLDFIKFFARRITNIHCLFILTYRTDEIHFSHPLRNVLEQLPADSFTRMQLTPLSKPTVEKMAAEKGYRGEDVYTISGGNPFYVNEILASYSPGIPDNIKDSILSVFNRQDSITKHVWEILSAFPAGLEMRYLEKMEPAYSAAIENCINSKILIINKGFIFFKHELYRRTIESSLSLLVKVAINKNILDLFLPYFEEAHETERIIHHAKNADEYQLVAHYAPLAAKQAALMGAHIEASRLWLSAIEYYQGNDACMLLGFYESYAYECYLTNQVKEAITYTGKSLNLWKKKNDVEKIGNCLRFLSRLWWFEGNRKNAECFGQQAIDALEDQPPSRAKAMAYSNMSQLKMLSDHTEECLLWGGKAIAMAKELADDEILSHAFNNVGVVQLKHEANRQKGIMLLQQSLDIALKNAYHEHAARAYANLVHHGIRVKNYEFAEKNLETGIQYCEERNLNSWTTYLLSNKAKLNLETGHWDNAKQIAQKLIMYDEKSPGVKVGALTVLAILKMRRGEADTLPDLLEAKKIAFETMELQRIMPAVLALLEYEWITGTNVIEDAVIDQVVTMAGQFGNFYENSELAFWLLKARNQNIALNETFAGYETCGAAKALKAATIWVHLGCPYEQALALFEGSACDKRNAITIIQSLGANAVCEKMKMEMRALGIKRIPRGIRRTTRANAALLTLRELEVLQLLKKGMQNKEIAATLFISAKTVDHHISAILYKLEAKSRIKAVQEAIKLEIIK